MSNESKPLEKITLRVFKGDIDRMSKYYPKVGYNRAIRTLISEHLKVLDEKVNQMEQELPPLDLDLNLEEPPHV